MSSKTTKKTTTVTSSVSSVQTPNISTSSVRSQSPLSPTRISRLQEKEDLQNLNDRLAVYIERVRQLEIENNRLNVQVQTSHEIVTREVTSIKSMYESELSDARKLLDETAKDKAKLQIECSKFRSEAEELAAKLAKKEKDLVTTEKNAVYYETKVQEQQARIGQMASDKKRLEDELKEMKSENDKLNKQVNTLRKQLEDETLARVDLENRLQSLKEELSFKQQVHEQQLSETHSRKQVEITKIDDHLQHQYEQKLTEALKELRESYEAQMRINRDEIETLYENKLQDVKKLSELNLGSAAAAREELRQSRTRIDTLSTRISDLENENSALNSRLKSLEQQLEDERNAHLSVMASKEEEVRQLKDLLGQQFREYQDLMDTKVALDMEIAAYRKLLEGEEARLNITAMRSPYSGKGTPVRRTAVGARGTKRKRVMMSEEASSNTFVSSASSKGEVEISEQDTEGKFVKLHNKGDKDVAIGAWQLIRKSGENEITYKFHRSINLKAGQTTTVWSSNCEVTHNPPSDMVMKNQKWIVGDAFTTSLMNNSGEEMATRETQRQMLSQSSTRSGDFGGYLEDGVDEGEPENAERCCVM